MPALNLNSILVGGPCKLLDNGNAIYFEDGVKLTPHPTWRQIPSDVGGDLDDVLVDLVWKITGRPKSVWNAAYRASLLPDAYTNWPVSGARFCGPANRAVSIIGADSNGFDFPRACLTKMPTVFGGVGRPLYGEVEYTAFIADGAQVTDANAFYSVNNTAWTQNDYPAAHQETLCTGAWAGVPDWDTVFAEGGFKLAHELRVSPVRQGNLTVDYRLTSYRAMISFIPQAPTVSDLLAALALQGIAGAPAGSFGIGSRRSATANDFSFSGPGLSVTVKSAAVNHGVFCFDNRLNRIGEIGMITALAQPGTRLVLA